MFKTRMERENRTNSKNTKRQGVRTYLLAISTDRNGKLTIVA